MHKYFKADSESFKITILNAFLRIEYKFLATCLQIVLVSILLAFSIFVSPAGK